jgi:hypothetical protein
MRRLDDRDLWAGIVFAAVGIAALLLGRELTIGSGAEMGEGYVPRAMAIALIALGVLIAATAAWHGLGKPEARFDGMRWRPILFVTAAVLAFVAALQPLGLVAAIAASATAANFAGQPLSVRALLVLIAVLSAGVIAIFVWGLGLPLRVLPAFAG